MNAAVFQAVIMGDFVPQGTLDLLVQFVGRAHDHQNGALEKRDLVRQDERVAGTALGQRNALVQPEQDVPFFQAGFLDLVFIRVVGIQNRHVVQPLDIFLGQFVHGAADEPVKIFVG